ncbi:hypothetical protein CDL12_08290 [Handroanthus impetiginosus]|uniref:Mei2-like C-terminal RNA recognition motif domain-containing protein n=1 Tax=Handroanthus impetiginosus TaxID=429701 RepID=A0A2G9HNE2_9LAMI|nr:hypothetical protein CDL12_08290 [Handroanthus impetiginosus]
MCIKLNPKAEEWRPTPHSPAQTAVPIVPFTATYTHPLQHQSFMPYTGAIFTNERHPFYYVPHFPTDQQCSYTAATVPKYISTPERNYMNFHEENMKSSTERKVESTFRGKSPKPPPANALSKGFRRAFPPRLQRTITSFSTLEKKPPVKREWRPARKSARPEFKVSGDGSGGGSQSPTFLDGELSNSSNTTVMIKNIPNKLRRDFMLKFLDEYCKEHHLEYDFLYLPMDFRKKDNLGYAFVNFTSAVAAMKFKEIVQNYKWGMVHGDRGPITSKKICETTWARIQGKEALVRRFKNSRFSCDEMEFLPVVLDPPRNGTDPNPPAPVTLGTLCPLKSSKIY